MHHEGIGSGAALLLRWRTPFTGCLTEGRRPRERQDVKIELSGCVLALILCGQGRGGEQERNGESGGRWDTQLHDSDPWNFWNFSERLSPAYNTREYFSRTKTE